MKLLGTTVADIRDEPSSTQGSQLREMSFNALEQLFRDIDSEVRPVIRRFQEDDRLIHKTYMDLYREKCRVLDVELDFLLRTLRDPMQLERVAATVPPPDLVVEVGAQFEYVAFRLSDDRILRISNPTLLWDCNDRGTEDPGHKRACPIHRHELGDIVASKMRGGLVQVRYRGAKFYYRQSKELWPPSVDAIQFLNTLATHAGLFKKPHRTVLDLGSGTGFLGILVALMNPHVVELDLSDWLMTPYLYSLINWHVNSTGHEHVKVCSRLGLFSNAVQDRREERYDLVLCNPPYLPLMERYEALGRASTTAGTDLLEHVIRTGTGLGESVYLQFSDLARPEAQRSASEANVKLRQVGHYASVPFRIKLLWEHPEYIQMLVDQRGLKDDPDSVHRYWHKLTAYQVVAAPRQDP